MNLSAMKGLSADRIDNLLRYWLVQQKVALPSHAQLQQIREQMLNASPDRDPRYDCGALHLRRLGNHLVREEDFAVPPSASRMLTWHGEDFIDIQEWRGRLIFQKSEEGGINPQRLLQVQLVLHPRSGQERLKLAPNRPSKTLKNLYQEIGLFPSQRRWLPLISLQDKLLFAAGLGMDIRSIDADFGIRFRWEKL